ncbi:hypothetical protein AAC387_Pa03g0447 [Persea americana]
MFTLTPTKKRGALCLDTLETTIIPNTCGPPKAAAVVALNKANKFATLEGDRAPEFLPTCLVGPGRAVKSDVDTGRLDGGPPSRRYLTAHVLSGAPLGRATPRGCRRLACSVADVAERMTRGHGLFTRRVFAFSSKGT